MDNTTLKRKVQTYKTEGGYLKKLPDDLLIEILDAWEQWTGKSEEFYKSIGSTYKQMAAHIGKAKKLKREGFANSEFKELKIGQTSEPGEIVFDSPGTSIVLKYKDNNIISFPNVDNLIEFLKKVV